MFPFWRREIFLLLKSPFKFKDLSKISAINEYKVQINSIAMCISYCIEKNIIYTNNADLDDNHHIYFSRGTVVYPLVWTTNILWSIFCAIYLTTKREKLQTKFQNMTIHNTVEQHANGNRTQLEKKQLEKGSGDSSKK